MSDTYFDYWFDNVLSSSRLIASPDLLRQAWVQGDKTITSAYNVDELLEQLLGDLRVNEHVLLFEGKLRELGVLEATTEFCQALLTLDGAINDDPRLRDPETLLRSQAWEKLKAAANLVASRNAGRGEQQPRIDAAQER